MIYLTQGNDYVDAARVQLRWTDPDTGLPIDLTGSTLWLVVKRRPWDDDDDALLTKTTFSDPAGITIDPDQSEDGNRGLSYVTIEGSDTAELEPGAWFGAAQGKDATDRVIEIPAFRVTIVRQLITATDVSGS